MNKVLVLGGSGLIGKEIINEMSKDNELDVYSTHFKRNTLLNENRSFKLDIENEDEISNILNTLKPNIVVSCMRGDFNKQLVAHIKAAEYLNENGGKMYFFSTPNVFDSDFSKPHYEDDVLNSHTDYGKYKIECEKKMVEMLQDNVCILRIPQIWGRNCLRMDELLKSIYNKEEVVLYPKFTHNTNTSAMVAKQLCYIINNNLGGIFHLTSEDVIGYKEFHTKLIEGLGFKNVKIKESFDVEGYFALLSKRSNEFPKELRITNESVISYLIK